MSRNASSSIADRKMEKSVGASTQPCLNPFVTLNDSETYIGVAFPNPMFAHDQGPLVIFWLGFALFAFGSVKNLYHKAVVYNSAWQGRQTP